MTDWKARDHRAMAGLSMEGMPAFQVTFNHLDLFSYIGGLSGAAGPLVLGNQKLDTKTADNGVFADRPHAQRKCICCGLESGQWSPRGCVKDSKDCIHLSSKRIFSTSSTNR